MAVNDRDSIDSLKGIFQKEAGFTDSFDSSPVSEQSSRLTSASQSFLGSLNGKNNPVSATALDTHQVQAQAGASSLVQKNEGIVTSVQQEAQVAKAGITSTIRQAQGEVVAAAKEAGYDAGALYPNNNMASGGEGALIAQAAFGASTGLLATKVGAGTFGKAISNTDSAFYALEDRKSFPNKKAAEAEIKDKLIQASSGPVDSRAELSISDIGKPAPEFRVSSINWENFFENDYDLQTLMDIEPDNPNPEIIREIALLNMIDAGAEEVLASLDQAEAEIAKIEADKQTTLTVAEATLLSDSLGDINGAKASGAEDLESETKETLLASLNNEPDSEKLLGLEADTLAPPRNADVLT